jgi:hypothetical protein
VQAPLFSELNPADGISPSRDPRLIILAGIVGVSWQDIARDLSQGFKNAAALAEPLPGGGTTWDVILGDPSGHVPPEDPLMIESTAPRSGVNPIPGDPTAPPGSRSNPINGSEWTIAAANDLQYACIFPPAAPRSCDGGITCDCEDPRNDSPLCSVDPTTGMNTLQVYAKAYPGLRQLSLLESLGEQGVTASTGARQTLDGTSADFAYRPAIRALIAQLGPRLQHHGVASGRAAPSRRAIGPRAYVLCGAPPCGASCLLRQGEPTERRSDFFEMAFALSTQSRSRGCPTTVVLRCA